MYGYIYLIIKCMPVHTYIHCNRVFFYLGSAILKMEKYICLFVLMSVQSTLQQSSYCTYIRMYVMCL